MQKLYKIFIVVFFSGIFNSVNAQNLPPDSTVTNLDADLLNIFNQKPRKYKINKKYLRIK